jgi:hypothetical protein
LEESGGKISAIWGKTGRVTGYHGVIRLKPKSKTDVPCFDPEIFDESRQHFKATILYSIRPSYAMGGVRQERRRFLQTEEMGGILFTPPRALPL